MCVHSRPRLHCASICIRLECASPIGTLVLPRQHHWSFILVGYGFFYNRVIDNLESIKEHLETSIDARMQSMESSLSNNASSLDRLESFVGRIEQMVKENTNKK